MRWINLWRDGKGDEIKDPDMRDADNDGASGEIDQSGEAFRSGLDHLSI
jgi:hypothetical protein